MKNLISIGRVAKVSIDDLINNPIKSSLEKTDDGVVFEALDVKAACGSGLISSDYPEIISRMVMPVEKAFELIGSINKSRNIKVIIAAKDSMVPTINPNDLLFVDTSINDYSGEAVYVLLHGGELLCKRLSLVGKDLKVISDNKSYESWLWIDRPEETRIIGKVVRALPMNFKNFGN